MRLARIGMAVVLAVALEAQAQPVLYVDQSVDSPPEQQDGESWATAFDDLQPALEKAEDDSAFTEIWVAEGTYHPSRELDEGDARSATFQLVDGVSIFGGFPAAAVTARSRSAIQRFTKPSWTAS